ncbi:MAG TPA: hypothetical protein VG867_08860 [Rhizomicrobium sp.]|nr:hypothetical protein [Rhizomicrobium sp.]
MRIAGFALLALLIPQAALAVQQSIVGDWYEEAEYGGYRTISIGHFRADGTFTVEFRRCLRPGEMDDTDTGSWTYANGDLRMTTQTRDGFWVFDIEDYQTVSNDGRSWIYKSVSGSAVERYGRIVFHDIRVTPDSKVPSCDLTS